jgi:hypothetical protein
MEIKIQKGNDSLYKVTPLILISDIASTKFVIIISIMIS